ncbi:hypothetical protein HanIR_Chr10g0460831 [Helianthus annuus]|nr:hypothetical protein HanIR_Chr10g0460831 [Helianthus annuus]
MVTKLPCKANTVEVSFSIQTNLIVNIILPTAKLERSPFERDYTLPTLIPLDYEPLVPGRLLKPTLPHTL